MNQANQEHLLQSCIDTMEEAVNALQAIQEAIKLSHSISVDDTLLRLRVRLELSSTINRLWDTIALARSEIGVTLQCSTLITPIPMKPSRT